MLIALTLAVLVAAAWGLFVWQTRIGWQGVGGQHGGRGYYSEIQRNKKAAVGWLVGVDAPSAFDFVLKTEDNADRLAKGLHLAEEFQTQDVAFDRAVYIVSDDVRVEALLARNAEARRAVLTLLHVDTTLPKAQLRCRAGRLWLAQPVHGEADLIACQMRDAEVVAALAVLADGLARVQLQDGRLAWHDNLVTRGALAQAVAGALLVGGAVQALRVVLPPLPQLLDPAPLAWRAVHIALGLTVALVVVTAVALGASARRHLVLARVVGLALAGGWLTAFALAHDVNRTGAQGEPQQLVTTVLSTRISGGRHPARYMTLSDLGAGPVEVQLPRGLFDQLPHRGEVVATVHPGALGWPWLETLARP